MKLDSLIEAAADLPFFDLATAVRLSGDRKEHVVTQLHRWSAAGKVLPLRRGLYTLASPYRNARLSPLALANEMIRPSYLTGPWALSFYGLIPEAVAVFTSVTTRSTCRFENGLGTFTYSSLKRGAFWGIRTRLIDQVPALLAAPEKALLDAWHLSRGEWTSDRLIEMRYQQLDLIDAARLEGYGRRWQSPRLSRAVHRFLELLETDGSAA